MEKAGRSMMTCSDLGLVWAGFMLAVCLVMLGVAWWKTKDIDKWYWQTGVSSALIASSDLILKMRRHL